ncbi:MAG: DeoR/GlpR family DNA-binding transcription regulator [Erysipelotrichaceae bacterium]|nr:DeoR/GlpR family DNA-binding transcription regulator [Erysipelotrichaceae bacterium]MDO5122878.1 DeoR/GlpR family DNA-binding transcription regulator [Erysipelotrichaceae bacterium]
MKKKREKEILSLLVERRKVEVTELSELLGVSQVTIRKDLDELEKMHMIKRVHGFAQLSSEDDINSRLAWHYEEKTKIAEKAAELISDGDTVFIENGSCCALAALTIAKTKKNVTIVTNSAFIAGYVRNEPNVQVVLLGGIYQKESQCLVGPMIRDNAMNYNVKYCMIGTDGWNERIGFTNKDQMRAQAVRDMSASAEQVVILTESDKFSSAGTVPLNLSGCKTAVLTDPDIPEDVREKLTAKDIGIMIA